LVLGKTSGKKISAGRENNNNKIRMKMELYIFSI
jgi:hypothetical protein